MYFINDTIDIGYVRESALTVPDRIYAQYRGKPKIEAWLNIVPTMVESLVDATSVVRNMYNIDNMVGAQLEIIGRIVVIPRNFALSSPMVVIQVGDSLDAQCGDGAAMCSALAIDVDSKMSDELYRLVIRAKIFKNNSDATIESILYGANFMLPTANVVRVIDGEDMTFGIEFAGQITELERWALLNIKLVPKPQGVRFNGFLETWGYVQSGDDSLQCGDTAAQCVGFIGV